MQLCEGEEPETLYTCQSNCLICTTNTDFLFAIFESAFQWPLEGAKTIHQFHLLSIGQRHTFRLPIFQAVAQNGVREAKQTIPPIATRPALNQYTKLLLVSCLSDRQSPASWGRSWDDSARSWTPLVYSVKP